MGTIRVPVLFRQTTLRTFNMNGSVPETSNSDDAYRRRIWSASENAGCFEFDPGWIREIWSVKLRAPSATGYTISIENEDGTRFVVATATGLSGVSVVFSNARLNLMEGDKLVVVTDGIDITDVKGAVCEVYADLVGQSSVPY